MKKGILIFPVLFIIVVSLTIVISSSIDYFHTNNYSYSSNTSIGNNFQGEVEKSFNQVKDKNDLEHKIRIENGKDKDRDKEKAKDKDVEIIISDKKLRSINKVNINESALTKNINNKNDNKIHCKDNNQSYTCNENTNISDSKVIVKNVDNESICNGQNKIDIYLKNDEVEEKPVFKVKTSQIMSNLTVSEQMKLFKIAQKLNAEDYTKIKEYLKARDQEKGIVNAIYLLKEKLSDDDYEKIRDIAERFIDMDVVEENGK